MSTTRLAYDDAGTLTDMLGDARAVTTRLALPGQRGAERHDARTEHADVTISDSLAAHAAELDVHYA